MNEAEVKEALRSHWMQERPQSAAENLWEDDEKFPQDELWTRVVIRSSGNDWMAAGRGREENRGLVMVQTFAPRRLGEGVLDRLTAEVAAGWRLFSHARIRLTAPSSAGLICEGAFNRQLVTLSWRADLRS